jgi:hypothetical protein
VHPLHLLLSTTHLRSCPLVFLDFDFDFDFNLNLDAKFDLDVACEMSFLKPSPSFAQRAISMLRRPGVSKWRWSLVAVFILALVWLHPLSGTASLPQFGTKLSSTTGTTKQKTKPKTELSFIKQLLKDNKIGPEIQFASRTIRYVPDALEHLPITDVDQELFSNSFVDLSINKVKKLPPGNILDVHVYPSARPDQIDASALLFAVSTTFERFSSEKTTPIGEWTRWLTDGKGNSNGAGLILTLFNTSSENIHMASKQLHEAGINATVLASNRNLDMAGRYVDLVHLLHNHPSRKQRKYFSLVDDDTFFPYIGELLHTLKRYNPTRSHYIGTFTERTDWMLHNKAPMAYGGAGVFMTAPVIQKVTELPCLEKDDEGDYVLGADQGDRLLYNCLHNYTELALSYLPRLRQEDQMGDASGFYEAGLQHLSFHHYHTWHELWPGKMHIVADACGEDCVLQRFRFKDDFIISNGYSVAHYPKGIDFDPLQMEATFDYGTMEDQEFRDVVFSYAFGMLRKGLSYTGRKKSWELLGAVREKEGTVKQVYLKRRGDGRWLDREGGEEHPENDSVVVLTWIP